MGTTQAMTHSISFGCFGSEVQDLAEALWEDLQKLLTLTLTYGFTRNATDANSQDNRRLLLHSKPIKELNENQ